MSECNRCFRVSALSLALLICPLPLRSQVPDVGPTQPVGVECYCNGKYTWYGSLPTGTTCRSLCVGAKAPPTTPSKGNAPAAAPKATKPAKGTAPGVVSKAVPAVTAVSKSGPNLQEVTSSVQSLVGSILADLERRDEAREAARKQEQGRLAEQQRQQAIQRQQKEAKLHQKLLSEMKSVDGDGNTAKLAKKTLPLGMKSLDEDDFRPQTTARSVTGASTVHDAATSREPSGQKLPRLAPVSDPLDPMMLDGAKELQSIANQKAELREKIRTGNLDDKALLDAALQLDALDKAEVQQREKLQAIQELQQRTRLDEILNRTEYAAAWQEAKARVRQKEVAAFAQAEAQLDPAQLELYQRIKQGRASQDTKEAQQIFDQLRKAQVAAMRQATQELMSEAQRLRDEANLRRTLPNLK